MSGFIEAFGFDGGETIRVSCEWPLVGISLSTAELDGRALVEATARVARSGALDLRQRRA